MSFEEDLKAEYEADRPSVDVDVALNGKPYTFRFTQMVGTEWAAATDQAPARPGVMLDTAFGYNLRALTLLAAPLSGKRVEGDKLEDLTPDQWKNLFRALPGASAMRICNAVFKLNQIDPAEAVEEAKKAFAGLPEQSKP